MNVTLRKFCFLVSQLAISATRALVSPGFVNLQNHKNNLINQTLGAGSVGLGGKSFAGGISSGSGSFSGGGLVSDDTVGFGGGRGIVGGKGISSTAGICTVGIDIGTGGGIGIGKTVAKSIRRRELSHCE